MGRYSNSNFSTPGRPWPPFRQHLVDQVVEAALDQVVVAAMDLVVVADMDQAVKGNTFCLTKK
ncbi:GL26624 [Drosophila persimilis]|uniref:GL26624 n=1 Tax=Drosophila persimilis TaxID=7234 RepID=B4GSY0_DROPE|nr:GL26624 [Drosophila persimilis]